MLLQPIQLSRPSGNVLFLIADGHSRWLTNTNVARELKEYGYNSTFVLPKGKEKQAADAGVELIVSEGMTKFEVIGNELSAILASDGFHGESNMFRFSIMNKFAEYCRLVAGYDKLMETLSKSHFDVLIVDTALVEVCMSVIAYKLSIPCIQFGRGFQVHTMRTLIHPGVYPVSTAFQLTNRMT